MRNILLETRQIDAYLLHEMEAGDLALFQTKMIVDPELKEKTGKQRIAHTIIKWFGRDEQRKKLEAIYSHLAKDTEFTSAIKTIFK
jgi:hypothetical protein